MQRYFVNVFEGTRFFISEGDLHHIVKVMRYHVGDEIFCVNNGKSAKCKIEEITDEQVVAVVVEWEEGTVELPVHVTIANGLPKGDKLEWIIQKGTELGCAEFIPFAASRSVVKWDEKKGSKKVERWKKIAKEAAEQSHRQMVPNISTPISFKTLIGLAKNYDQKLIAYEEDAKQGESSELFSCLSSIEKDQSILFVFGPEGGLAKEEVALLKEAGFRSCGLGPRILRTETAPLYVLSAVSYHTELMR